MLYTLYCIILTAFLLLSAILYFMCMCITPSKAHAYRLTVASWVAMVSLESLPIAFEDDLFLMVNPLITIDAKWHHAV